MLGYVEIICDLHDNESASVLNRFFTTSPTRKSQSLSIRSSIRSPFFWRVARLSNDVIPPDNVYAKRIASPVACARETSEGSMKFFRYRSSNDFLTLAWRDATASPTNARLG